MNFVRAVDDTHGSGARVRISEAEIHRHPGRAMRLDRPIQNLAEHGRARMQ